MVRVKINNYKKSTYFILKKGDPELVTTKTLNAIKSADLIVHDRLIAPDMLQMIKSNRKFSTKLLEVPADKNCQKATSEAFSLFGSIKYLILKALNQGNNVVRLVDGDPLLFSTLHSDIYLIKNQHGIKGNFKIYQQYFFFFYS